jgi:hypothetical protein
MKLYKLLRKYKYIIIFILCMLFIIYRNNRDYQKSFIIYRNNIDYQKSVIIVGKGPNLEDFMKNKDKYENIDKLALNSAVFLDLDYKYFLQQDFSIPQKENLKNNFYYKDISKKITTAVDNINYAKKKNISVILPDLNGGKYNGNLSKHNLFYNKIPKEISSQGKFWETINVDHASNKFGINYYNNKKVYEYQQVKDGTGTVFWTSVLYLIDKGYKNIYITGITTMKEHFGDLYKKKHIDFMNNIKKIYPKVNIICLYPTQDTKGIFTKDIFTKDNII